MYDESSQDATTESQSLSFDEERQSSPQVKQEPMDSNPAPDSVDSEAPVSVTVKTEPVETDVSDSTIPFLTQVKVEPMTDDIPFLSDINSGKKVEGIPFLNDSNVEPETDVDETSGKSTQVSMEQDTPEVANQTENKEHEVDEKTLNKENIAEVEEKPEHVMSAVDDSNEAMDTNEGNITEKLETEEYKNTISPSVSENATPTMETTEAEKIRCKSGDNVEMELKEMEASADPISTVVSSTPVESTAVLSDIHVETNDSHLAPPEQSCAGELQHSPTYSMLNKVKLSVAPEPIDISQEVLEIGSNASTPTRDELPSPDFANS